MRVQYQPPEDWKDFERMCSAIFSRAFGIKKLQPYGRSGSSQKGVDLFGKYRSGFSLLGIQCKSKQLYPQKNITIREVNAEIEKAKKFEPELSHYIIATSASRNTEVQDYLLNNVEADDTLRFKVEVIFWDDIQDYLNKSPDLVNEFYLQQFAKNSPAISKPFKPAFHEHLKLGDESDVFYYYASDNGEIFLKSYNDNFSFYLKKDSIFAQLNRFGLSTSLLDGNVERLGHMYIDVCELTDLFGLYILNEEIESFSLSSMVTTGEFRWSTLDASICMVYVVEDGKIYDDSGFSIPSRDEKRISAVHEALSEIALRIRTKTGLYR